MHTTHLDKPGPRPTPLSQAEREAVIGRYGVKGLQSMEGREGYAYSYTLTRDGKPFARVREDGNGGMVFIDTESREDAQALRDDAIAWYVGSKHEIQSCIDEGTVPSEIEGFLAEELFFLEQERKELMRITRGGKAVLYQVGDEIRGHDFRQRTKVAPELIDVVVAQAIAEAQGRPVRVVSRDPANTRKLRDEIHNL